MPLDDRFARYNHSCLFDLDDPHERIGGGIFSLPSLWYPLTSPFFLNIIL